MRFTGISLFLLLFAFAAQAQVKLPQKENNTPVKQTPAKTTETKPTYSEPVLVLKVTTGVSCKFYIDGEYYATIEADDVKKVSLRKGEYQFKAVSTANPDEVFKKIYSVTKEEVGGEKYYEIDFQAKTTSSPEQNHKNETIQNGNDAQVTITWAGPGSAKLKFDKEEFFFTEGQKKTLGFKSEQPYSLKAEKPDKTYSYNEFLGFRKGEQNYTISLSNSVLRVEKAFISDKNDLTKLKLDANTYLAAAEYKEAAVILQKILQITPNDYLIHFALGSVYDNLSSPTDPAKRPTELEYLALRKQAQAAYKKTLEINPDYFDAVYNLGALYYNDGVTILTSLANITDNTYYDNEKKRAEELLLQALPYLEHAYFLNPNDKNVLNSLKQLYLRNGNKEKYNEVVEKLNRM